MPHLKRDTNLPRRSAPGIFSIALWSSPIEAVFIISSIYAWVNAFWTLPKALPIVPCWILSLGVVATIVVFSFCLSTTSCWSSSERLEKSWYSCRSSTVVSDFDFFFSRVIIWLRNSNTSSSITVLKSSVFWEPVSLLILFCKSSISFSKINIFCLEFSFSWLKPVIFFVNCVFWDMRLPSPVPSEEPRDAAIEPAPESKNSCICCSIISNTIWSASILPSFL